MSLVGVSVRDEKKLQSGVQVQLSIGMYVHLKNPNKIKKLTKTNKK